MKIDNSKNLTKVGILHYALFPWVRPIAQLNSLLMEIGYAPVIFSAFPEPRYQNKVLKDFDLHYFRSSNSRIQKIKSLHVPFNLFWGSWLLTKCIELKIDCLIVKETPLSYIAQRVARKLKIPVFLDMRENLPVTYSLNRSKKIPLPAPLQYRLSSWYEKAVLPHYDHILTVTDELRELVKNKYGIHSDKVSTLGNYPDLAYLNSVASIPDNIPGNRHEKLRFVFSGFVSEDRGIQDIIEAVSLIKATERPELTIIGEGEYISELKSQAARLHIEESVNFTDFVLPEDLPVKLSEFDVGLCPYLLNEQTHRTMPGKLFEYMAVGLPILSSSRKPVIRVVNDAQCGLIYTSRDPKGIAEAMITMDKDRTKTVKMGLNGKNAVHDYYNYSTNLEVLRNVLETVM